MNPEISIITVTMNHLSLLKEMLASLFVHSKPTVTFELILVDNCSTDGTVDYVKENYPTITIIENRKIQGFSKNNNDGAKKAKGNYILILNPDIVLIPRSIDLLHQYMERHQSTGIIAPKLLNPDGSLQYSARKFISLNSFFVRIFTGANDDCRNKKVKEYLMSDISYESAAEVDWCMGAALLFKKDFYFDLNGFDEKFFLYVEDADICHRTWQKGKKVIYYPESRMIHKHQRSSAKQINKKTLTHIKSVFYFFWKNKFKITRGNL